MKDKDPAAKSPRPHKEPYQPPRLTERGNVRELTQGGPTGAGDMGADRQKKPVQ